MAHADSIYFDLIFPFARPMVPVVLGQKRGMAALDTGSSVHAVGARFAEAPRPADEVIGFDYAGWPIQAFRLDEAARVFGWTVAPLYVSEWAERPRLRPKGMPHTEAVVSPQLLPKNGNAILIDFLAGVIEELPWTEARARVALYPLSLGEVRGQGQFTVATNLGELVVDTGAPNTTLYEARDPDLPAKAVQRLTRWEHLRAGAVVADVEVEVFQPLSSLPARGGLLGMDILRACALAMDAQKMVVRCVPR